MRKEKLDNNKNIVLKQMRECLSVSMHKWELDERKKENKRKQKKKLKQPRDIGPSTKMGHSPLCGQL